MNASRVGHTLKQASINSSEFLYIYIQPHPLRHYITSVVETLYLKDMRINYYDQSHLALNKNCKGLKV
jgi:hypothetical protein